MDKMSGYKITEQDIDGVVNYLRIFHPENASREYALELLEYIRASARRLAFTDPDALHAIYEEFLLTKSVEENK